MMVEQLDKTDGRPVYAVDLFDSKTETIHRGDVFWVDVAMIWDHLWQQPDCLKDARQLRVTLQDREAWNVIVTTDEQSGVETGSTTLAPAETP